MASDIDASCESDPNFAVVCAFLEKFGAQCGLINIDFLQLQYMLENTIEVPKELHEMLLKLLRKTRKTTVSTDRWEKALVKVIGTCNIQDAWEVERFGYKKAKLSSKVRILKTLLEMQFDYHLKFKTEINKISAPDLRSQPLGRDKSGHAYWFLSDDNYQIRVYKEDLDDEKWKLVAKDRAGLVNLINQLSDGDTRFTSDSPGNEDSNSMSDKPILDTGQQDSKKTTPDDSEDSNQLRKQKLDDESLEHKLKISNLSDLIGKRTSEQGPIVVLEKLPKIPDQAKKEDESPDKTEETRELNEKSEFTSEISNTNDLVGKISNDEVESPIVVLEKLPKITIKSFAKCPEVSAAIEDPVMRIEGEGNGKENQCDFETNVIVGDEIVEDVLYIFGIGEGALCQTGNKNVKEGSSKCSSDSINENIGTENKDISVESKLNDKNNSESKSEEKSTTPKKNLFFFGTGSQSPFKSSVFSPTVTMGFGNPKKGSKSSDDQDIKVNDSDENIKLTSDTFKGAANNSDAKVTNSGGNDIHKQAAATLDPTSNIITERLPIECCVKETGKGTSVEKLLSTPQTDRTQTVIEEEQPVVEPVCIKKVTYVCGDEKEIKNGSENETIVEYIKEKEHTNKDLEAVEDPLKECSTNQENKTLEAPKSLPEMEEKVEISSEDENYNTNMNGDDTNDLVKQKNEDVPMTDVEPEVVYVKGRVTRSKNKVEDSKSDLTQEHGKKITNKNSSDPSGKKRISRTLDRKSAESSVASSPQSTIESVISSECADNVSAISNDPDAGSEKDPLAVSDQESEKNNKSEVGNYEKTKDSGDQSEEIEEQAEGIEEQIEETEVETEVEEKNEDVQEQSDALEYKNEEIEDENEETENTFKMRKKNPVNLTSFSLDYSNSPTLPIPVISPLRSLRKRARNASPLEAKEESSGKKPKIKGRRQVDTKLRKSIEEQKNQQISSSDNECEEKEQKKNLKAKKKTRQPAATSEDSQEPPTQKFKKKKQSRMLASLGIPDTPVETVGVRASRRIAQMKIREQVEPKKAALKQDDKRSKKKSLQEDKEFKPEKRKRNKYDKDDESSSEPEVVSEKKKKKKKKEKAPGKIFNENRPWQSSSESSEEEAHATDEDDEEPIEYEYEAREPKSDHEFSPESDIEDAEWQPLKRARTARKEDDEVDDGCVCQKCGKYDHPEWILLCDMCDNGWHCSCLRPPLLEIPEGDWFCPPCQHIKLLENLQAKLIEYDRLLSKKQLEDRRKERLAYVGISLNNVLPSKDVEHRKRRRHSVESGSTSGESTSESESESDSDEPIYQLRQRRQAKSYKFSEYDEMIKSALGDDVDEPKKEEKTYGRGKDMNTIINAEKQEQAAAEKAEREVKEGQADELDGKPPVVPKDTDIKVPEGFVPLKQTVKRVPRRKTRKLTGLDVSSDDDDYSDEDFKGTSTEEESEEEEQSNDDGESEDSDDYVGRKRRKNAGPVRRSTRARTSRFDADFINDDSDDAPKKKKKRSIWDESDTDNSSDWSGKRKKKGGKRKKKNCQNFSEGQKKKTKSRIKYGGLTSSDEDLGRGRRTRGKRTTYVDSLGSDESDEETKMRNPRKIESDDDEDFVANEEDEKDSDENVEAAEEEDGEEVEEEEEEVERRILCVPKIYIKKPSTDKLKEAEEKKILEEKAERIQNENKSEEKDSNEDHKKVKSPSKKLIENPEEMRRIEAINQELKNTIDEINKDLENLGSEDSEKLIEDEEFANKQLRLVAERLKLKQQLERSKPVNPVVTKPFVPPIVHEPIVGNMSALLKNDDENDDLSEPPGISLPMFTELAPVHPKLSLIGTSPLSVEESPKKRRGRGKGKKTLEEEARRLAEQAAKEAASKGQPVNIEIAAPPQPFSQTQPTPSVITRMLQTKPGQAATYPVGTIRPKQFATMPDDDDDEPPRNNSRGSSPAALLLSGKPPPNRGGQAAPPKGDMPPYRSAPGMNHYPPPPRAMPPHASHHMPGPPPPHMFHRQMDPSASGGGPVSEGGHNPVGHGVPPAGAVPPASGSPCSGPPPVRYPPMGAPPRPPVPYPYSASNTNPPPGYYGEYPPAPPPGPSGEELIEYGNIPPYVEPYNGSENQSESSTKVYEESEPSGEFGGLVSYFSSQREDDLDS